MFLKRGIYSISGSLGLCLLISCIYLYYNQDSTLATPPNKRQIETILFSNNQYLNSEKNYYNALLEIQNTYPTKVNSFQIIFQSENKAVIKRYHINTYPTLLIVDNGNVLVRIEGKQTVENIFKRIEGIYKE